MKTKSTRDKILHTLLAHPHSTISELAEAVSINSISVRHHLTNLQAEGLVTAEEERHGVGRPRLVYNLTENGLERFPTRYMRLADLLIRQLKNDLPAESLQNLFTQIAAFMAEDILPKMKDLSVEERLDLTRTTLEEEGFSVDWQKEGEYYIINEISCPYYHIGQNHPEICGMDQTLISTLLSIPVEKIQCVLDGDQRCCFRIPENSFQE